MEKENQNNSLLAKWKSKRGSEKKIFTVEKAPAGIEIPLSSGQQRLWFLQQLYPGNPFYNYSEPLVFEGDLNVGYLKKSLHHLVSDNPILRSYYPVVDGRPILKTGDTYPEISTFDFSNLRLENANIETEAIMRAQSRTDFDLSQSGLLKVSLIKSTPKKHVLFLTMHHIIIDEWSIDILKQELAANYRSLLAGQHLEEKNVDIGFSDYAYWQRNQSLDRVQLDYWKNKLKGEIPVLNLKTDFNRLPKPMFKGAQYTKCFSKDLSERIFSLTKKLETTPFVFLLAVYYIQLQKYTAQTDILIGTPISNRNHKALENLLGFFIDTVVLRNEVDVNLLFSQFLKNVKKVSLEAFSNKEIPFDILVKELKVERSLAVNPLFQVMFLYHSPSEKPSFGENLELIEDFDFPTEVAKFDLTFSLSESKGRLSATFMYDTDLFEASTITKFVEHYEMLLQRIIDDPNRTIAEMSMITKDEEFFFLEKRFIEDVHFTSFAGIHEVISDVAEKHPAKTAVTFENRSITYKMLDEKSDIVALSLLQNKKTENKIIALCADRSVEMIVGLLGVLKAGFAYLPIDPEYPTERIDFILEDTGCDLVVTDSKLASLFETKNKTLVLLDKIQASDHMPSGNLPVVNENDIAYIIYTSGSTGKPKGVPISHKNIIGSTSARLNYYPENPDAFLLMSSISFDSSKAGIFWTLCTGGNLVIAEKRVEQDILKMENLIQKNSISHTLMLPSIYKLLLEHADTSKIKSLSNVIVAGEACPVSLGKIHFDILPEATLYNEYGPTEATVWSTVHHITEEDIKRGIPIGKPIDNLKIYLLDENLELVPFGATGEIYIGGPSLTSGYLNRPELSSKSFITNPQAKIHSGKIYKTGDLARYRSDGALEFLGRVDQQVKIRGFRVELDEIEKAIEAEETIQSVIATVEESKVSGDETSTVDFLNSKALTKYLKKHLSKTEIDKLLSEFESKEKIKA